MSGDPLTMVLDAFATVTGAPAPHGADTTPDDVERWTSLTHVQLVHEVESQAGVELPETVLTARGSLALLVEAVRTAAPS